jgi:hypothetical protein
MNPLPTPSPIVPARTGEEERAAIVAWLRGLADHQTNPDTKHVVSFIAHRCEAGDHIPTGEER